MQLTVNRKIRTDQSTIGELLIDGKHFCYTLEDVDRGLKQGMALEDIKRIKVPHKTCIPAGTYELGDYISPKHGNQRVPLVKDVPGFDFIEIHSGNTAVDTDGCLLVGDSYSKDFVGNSKATVAKLYPIIFGALDKGEAVQITYQ